VSYSSPPAIGPALAPRWRWLERLLAAGAGGAVLILLAVAAWLTPNPRGLGTHQQLGLPPCTIVEWYGVRCPSCGMTTAWSHILRGQVVAAFRCNAGGAVLAAGAVICGPWLLLSGLWGRWLVSPPGEGVTLTGGLILVAVTLIDWTLRVGLGW
jgi:Protein of unknown function (DUF2752)